MKGEGRDWKWTYHGTYLDDYLFIIISNCDDYLYIVTSNKQ